MDTFPFYQAYSPLVDHTAILIHLWQHKACLGADDAPATHSLVLDTEQHKIYLATRGTAAKFLEMQLPQTPDERRASDEKLQQKFEEFERAKNLGDFQKMGMFQFLAPADDRSHEVEQMCRFLDEYVPAD